MDIITQLILAFYPHVIGPLITLLVGTYLFKLYRHRQYNRRYKRYNQIRLKRAAGIPITDEEDIFFRRYKPVKRKTLWSKIRPRVLEIAKLPRTFIASIYTDYNPLALRDQVDTLEDKLKSVKRDWNRCRCQAADLDEKVKKLEKKIPKEEKEENPVPKKSLRPAYVSDFV